MILKVEESGKEANMQFRGMKKTYSLRALPVHDDDLPRKRIRMDVDGTAIEELINQPEDQKPSQIPHKDRAASSSTVPSSPPPSDRALSSDINAPRDRASSESPPSSPPPRLPSPPAATKKPAFSFLKRKRSTRHSAALDSATEPLANVEANVQKQPARPLKRTRLTQMQIDLGGDVRKTCKACGMEFIPSNKEDAALHKEFHAMNIGGVDLGKGFLSSKDGELKRAYPKNKRWLDENVEMVAVDRRSPLAAKNKVKKVLEVVNTELGSAEIPNEVLWASLVPNTGRVVETRKKGKESSDGRGDRFKAFLHLDGDKCLGFCLAEKISKASRVVDANSIQDGQPDADTVSAVKSSSISVSPDTDLALLGIARIWTSKSHRGEGIAKDLLETARVNFFYGMEVPKELVAFSQPTESGGRLAESWYGQATGWHVYGERS